MVAYFLSYWAWNLRLTCNVLLVTQSQNSQYSENHNFYELVSVGRYGISSLSLLIYCLYLYSSIELDAALSK